MSALLRQLALPSLPKSQQRLALEFVAAFPADAYRVQVLPRREGGEVRAQNRKAVSSEDLLRLVDSGTLARANAKGACIFARPIRRDLVLVDDLPPHSISTLRNIGLEPAAVIQSSPQKTNCILHFPSIEPDNIALHTLVQRSVVATLLDLGLPADPAAARDMQVWRLPGFSNRKLGEDGSLKYKPLYYTRFIETSPGTVPRRADEFVSRAREQIASDEGELSPTMTRIATETALADGGDIKTIFAPDRYIAAVLLKVVDAPQGSRNFTLFGAAFSLFRFAHGCAAAPVYAERMGFAHDIIARRLAAAAAAVGLPMKEIEATLRSASRAAAEKPVFPEVPGVSAVE